VLHDIVNLPKDSPDRAQASERSAAVAREWLPRWGLSGAEIEQVIVSALYAAHAEQAGLDTQTLMQAIRDTRPLSLLMAEQVQALREWALPRTVPAD